LARELFESVASGRSVETEAYVVGNTVGRACRPERRQRGRQRPAAAPGVELYPLAESDLERIGKIGTQGHQGDEHDNDEETEADNQHMLHAGRACLAGECVQSFLLCVRAAQ
jgi:hypothetical protein